MLDCDQCFQLLGSYLDGDLPPLRRLELEAHCAHCLSCRRLVLHCQQTIHVYRHQPPLVLPAALHQKLMARVTGGDKLRS